MTLDQTAMRVCMLVRNPFTHDTRVHREASALAEAGYQVTVIAHRATGLPDVMDLPQGFRVIRVAGPRQIGLRTTVRQVFGSHLHESPVAPSSLSDSGKEHRLPLEPLRKTTARWNWAPLLKSLKRIYILVKAAWVNYRIIRLIVSIRPHVIHAHDRNSLYASSRAKHRLKIPLVYDAHELETARPFHTPAQRAWAKWSERRWIRNADAVITVSQSIGSFLESEYGIRPPSIVLNTPPRAVRSPIDIRAMVGLPLEVRVVLYLGGMAPFRGLETLIRSAPLLNDAHVVLMGPSTYFTPAIDKAIADAALSERITRIGPCDPADVVPIASSADVGVSLIEDASLSYRWSLPNKLFEYINAGLPVVVSDLPEMGYIVEREEIGEVCTPTDEHSVAEAINRILDDRNRAARYRRNSREAAKTYNWDNQKTILIQLYETLLTGPDSAACVGRVDRPRWVPWKKRHTDR